MDLRRSSNIDRSQDFFGGGQSFRPPVDSKPLIKQPEADSQPESICKSLQAAQKELSENPGNDAQKALQGLLKRADNLTAQQVESHIRKLEDQLKAANSLKIGILVSERDASLADLPGPEIRQEAAALASLLEKAKLEPPSPFMDCVIAKLTTDLKKLAPTLARKQEQIDRITSSDEIELLKGFKDLPFKGRLSLVLTTPDAVESAQHLTEMAAQFSDWELNRQFSRLSPEQAKQLDERLQQSRNGIFQNYWELWNPEVQARAQQLESALELQIEELPIEKQAEARQLISDLCEPKKQNDPVVCQFLLNHISPRLAEQAQQLANLRAPLRSVEKQDKALGRLKKHLDIFGPVGTLNNSH
jgi:hypothetical protein